MQRTIAKIAETQRSEQRSKGSKDAKIQRSKDLKICKAFLPQDSKKKGSLRDLHLCVDLLRIFEIFEIFADLRDLCGSLRVFGDLCGSLRIFEIFEIFADLCPSLLDLPLRSLDP
jgi:hypothetical protein